MQSIKYLPASSGVGNPSLMTVQTLRAANATTIITNTVAGVPAFFYATMGTPHTFTDPVTGETITIISEATAVDFAGHTNSGQLVIDAIAPGYTDAGSKVGDIIVLRPLTEWSNNLFNILNAGAHNDDGTLAKTALDTFYKPAELVFDHVASGAVLAGLGYGSTLTASLSAGVCYINGLRQIIAALVTRTYTASKDTYVDALYNASGTATIVYTEVVNNAASPALAANSIRLGIVVTGAASIIDATYVNQGQETARWPQSNSNTVYVMTTDTLGNLICPRDPSRKLLSRRETYATFSTTATTWQQITGLIMPIIVPAGRKVRIRLFCYGAYNGTSATVDFFGIFDGTLTDGNRLTGTVNRLNNANADVIPHMMDDIVTPATTSKTYLGGFKVNGGTGYAQAQARGTVVEGGPMYITAELV